MEHRYMECQECHFKQESDDYCFEWECPKCKHINDSLTINDSDKILTDYSEVIPNSYQNIYLENSTPPRDSFLEKVAETGWVIACIILSVFIAMYIMNNILFAFLIWIYFIPTLCARIKEHPSILSIFVINLFLGWILIGWVIALAWALKSDHRIVIMVSPSLDVELERLASLRDKGIITKDEFEVRKNRLLG